MLMMVMLLWLMLMMLVVYGASSVVLLQLRIRRIGNVGLLHSFDNGRQSVDVGDERGGVSWIHLSLTVGGGLAGHLIGRGLNVRMAPRR